MVDEEHIDDDALMDTKAVGMPEARKSSDISHLNPVEYEIVLYMWLKPRESAKTDVNDYFWHVDPPPYIQVVFKINGSLNRSRRVFDVHLVLTNYDVPTQTWGSMGVLAYVLKQEIEQQYDVLCRPFDRTVIDLHWDS